MSTVFDQYKGAKIIRRNVYETAIICAKYGITKADIFELIREKRKAEEQEK